MKKILVIVTLLLTACTQQPTRVDIPGSDQSEAIPIKDFRPPSEKESETFSFLITSGGYGISRQGDATLTPPMTQILRRLVYDKVSPRKKGVDLTIYHMIVYANLKSELRRGALFAGFGGVVGAVIASSTVSKFGQNISQGLVDRNTFETAKTEEYERAFYTDTENPKHSSVYVIYIDASVNGKRVFVRTLSPVRSEDKNNAYALATKSAVQYFVSLI